jgi:hypothetical protein
MVRTQGQRWGERRQEGPRGEGAWLT